MNSRSILLGAAALLALSVAPAVAQYNDAPDPNGYYSENDHQGYYDRDGRYHYYEHARNYSDRDDDRSYSNRGYDRSDPDESDRGPPPGYYRQGEYERRCHAGNTAAGTVFGAAGGGVIGGVASHGNPAAIVGGVLLGGLLGHAISSDINCDDQRYAFDVYADGLNGEIGRRYEWHHGDAYGTFTPTREFSDNGDRCREFVATTNRNGRETTHEGVACYRRDGNWHFRDA
jgi:surface antigen